jgi:hypothetical protein
MFRFKERRVYIPKLIVRKEEHSYISNSFIAKAFLCVGRDVEVKSVIASCLSYYSKSLTVYDEDEIKPAYYLLEKTGGETVTVFRQRAGDLAMGLLKFRTKNIVTDARSLFMYLQENTDVPIANEWMVSIWKYFIAKELLTHLFTAGIDGTYYEVNPYSNISVEIEKFIAENLPRLKSLLKKPA